MTMRRSLALFLALSLTACAGTPGPGDSGYPFNVEGSYRGAISVDGQGFSGTMQLRTEAGGMVSGSFEITQPVGITGRIEGMLVGDQLTLAMRYANNPATGCTGGAAEGTVTVDEGGSMIRGRLTVNDCGASLAAQMNFRR